MDRILTPSSKRAAAPAPWFIASAALLGTSHVNSGLPCQDSIGYREVDQWFVGVVADGAGSARKSHFGSRLVVREVTEYLENALSGRKAPGMSEDIFDAVRKAIIHARELLSQGLLEGETLKDYHCTLVGIVADENGGVFFHVGDGLGMASSAAIGTDKSAVYWDRFTLSLPENGEYANETYFVTQDNWQEHLRFKPIKGPIDIVVLASDGPMSLLLQRGEPNSGFIDVVLEHLTKLEQHEDRDGYVCRVLSAPEVDTITNDDKSLLIAMNRRLRGTTAKRHVPRLEPQSVSKPVAKKMMQNISDNSISHNSQGRKTGNCRSFLQEAQNFHWSPKIISIAIAMLLFFFIGSAVIWVSMQRSKSSTSGQERTQPVPVSVKSGTKSGGNDSLSLSKKSDSLKLETEVADKIFLPLPHRVIHPKEQSVIAVDESRNSTGVSKPKNIGTQKE